MNGPRVRGVLTSNRCAVRVLEGDLDRGALTGERGVVERTVAWLHSRGRLHVRNDRRADIHESFLDLACCLICWRQLETSLS